MSAPLQLTAEEVERGYDNRAAVPEYPQWFARWAERSDAARASLRPRIDVRYGSRPKETLDLFVPQSAARGTFVFIHGGYWRALDKREHGFVAPPFVAQGFAVAVINYDLCPEVSIATIVDQCRRAIVWLAREGASAGADPGHIVVSGHSAGGHLAAMLHATDWRGLGLDHPPIHGGVSVSGVHDLTPMVRFSYNADLRLDEAEAARLSPVRLRPTTEAPFLVAVGAEETSEFRRQADVLDAAWQHHRPPGVQGVLSVPQRHHFSVIADYGDPDSALTRSTVALFARP